MIAGYPGRASVAPGERLVLHVATDAPRFRVRFARWADGFVPLGASEWLAGRAAPPRGAADDWNWPAYEFALPRHWPSGVYVARFQEPHAVEHGPASERPSALFVVRGAGRAGLLYVLPLATYHAYNRAGGGCFYENPPRSPAPPGSKVSLRRPGGGIGGEPYGDPDHYDPGSARQTFAHWDAPFVRWLARRGYAAEFCTDLDLHRDPRLCERYRLLLVAGHDEYWSAARRDALERFVARGGNLAFFSANVCWWRVHLVDEEGALVCHQGGPRGALDHWWAPSGANRPEDALSGVSYRHGGGWWAGPRRTRGYVVQEPEHWAFAGTGLRRGDAFGADTTPPLVGYECDGAPLARFDERSGIAALAPDARRHGTPPGFRVLAAGPLGADWQELPARAGLPAGAGVHAAAMGIFTRGGTTFSAGTTDWAQVLASGADPRVERITRNVVERLLGDGALAREAAPARPTKVP